LAFGPSHYLPLKDISATGKFLLLLAVNKKKIVASRRISVQQLDVRLEQAVFFLTQVSSLQRQNTHDVASYSVRYTKLVSRFSDNDFAQSPLVQFLQHILADNE
jgi:putative IMPACT (imprinted ancient) family translation regulator